MKADKQYDAEDGDCMESFCGCCSAEPEQQGEGTTITTHFCPHCHQILVQIKRTFSERENDFDQELYEIEGLRLAKDRKKRKH